MDNVVLEFDEGAISAIAEKAVERKTGARGLRSIVENLLMDAMYEAPSIEGEKEIIVTKENVEKNETPKINSAKLLA